MITMRELAYALFGVWRLLHLDKNGLQYLDDSIDGYWKSFAAALVVLPGFAIMQLLELVVEPASVGVFWPRVVMTWAIVYVLHWTLFPIAAAYITAEMGRSDQYLKFIVAHNWASVIQIAIVVPAVALQVLTGPEGAGVFLFLLITIGLLFYSWFIAKTTLDISGMMAAGFVVLDVVLSLALNAITAALTGL
ncbi:MAG: hypothetical protein ACTSX7_19160 [Alphaproteobacteria bacterium]